MIDPELVEAVRSRQAILFVGAGVSRTIGLPSFRELINDMATELDYQPEVFTQLGQIETLAEYYKLEKEGFGDLRSRLDVEWHRSEIDISESRVHKLITMMRFPLIYTTNWDRWLEKAHDRWEVEYDRVVNISDLRTVGANQTQIVKFHGDFSDDQSLVLAESSYLERLDFSTPLDIKLRSDAQGRTILFLGYSLTDINTRLLLFKLHKLWAGSRHFAARPRSFLVMDRPNPIQERVLREWGVTYLVAEDGADETERLENFLALLATEAVGRDESDRGLEST